MKGFREYILGKDQCQEEFRKPTDGIAVAATPVKSGMSPFNSAARSKRWGKFEVFNFGELKGNATLY